MNKEIMMEGLRELARVAVLAVIPVTIDQLSNDSINWKTIAVVGAIALLRALDKLLHESGKVSGSEFITRGITRF